MRELTIEEMSVVGGAFVPPSQIHPFMDARIALTTFRAWGYVGAAFTAGYTLGELLNEHTGLQAWLADNIDMVAGKLQDLYGDGDEE